MADTKTENATPQVAPTPTTSAPAPTQVQRKASKMAQVQLKRGLQEMDFAEGSALLAPVQRHGEVQKRGEDTGQVHEAAARGIASGGGALPHADKIQKAFGSHDVSGIQAHTGAAASEANKAMGAEAYATGNHVAFGGAPDLHTVAHEAAHVVQQGHGVSLSGGVGKAGDAYEQHADKVADAVVKGESAEPILDQMTGGGAKGTQKKDVQQRAEVVQRTGAGGGGGGGGPPPTDPEALWQTYLDGLPGPVKAAAATLSAADRDTFRGLNPVQQQTYAKMTATTTRQEFLTNGAVREAMVVIAATPAHLSAYETGLATAAERDGFRAITPDERTDVLAVTQATYRTQLLTDTAALNEWRTWRNVAVMQGQPDVCAALGVNPADPIKFAEEVGKLSIGKAGERLRRLAVEEGFEVPATKTDSLAAIQAKVKTEGKDPWAAMEDLRPAYAFKGKLTKNDGAFGTLPILKAVAYTDMIGRNPMDPVKWKAILEKNITDPDCPKDPADPTKVDTTKAVSSEAKTRMFKHYMREGGTFNPMVDMVSVPIRSGVPAAYWMYDTLGIEAALKKVETTGAEVIKLCAIEESPQYQDGFIIVKLDLSVPAVHDQIRRPTMWDGLFFDQFKGVDDPAQSYGITSGGQGEVMVGVTQLSACSVVRNVERV